MATSNQQAGAMARVITKLGAIARRGAPSLRNVIFARMDYWPCTSLKGHWMAQLPVYCVSLKRAVWRRKIIASQVKKMQLENFQFVDAVDARDLEYTSLLSNGLYDPSETNRYHTRGLTLPEIACSLSHAECYRLIESSTDEWSLVIEDDALFRCQRLLNLSLDEIPSEIDIVFMNTFLTGNRPSGRVLNSLYSDTSYNGSAAGYLLRHNTAHRLRQEAIPVVHAADGLLGRALDAGESLTHSFRGRGSDLRLRGMIVYPEAITNGSVEHYTKSTIR